MLEFLVRGPSGTASLREQAEVVEVVATCSCGCPSVWLDAPGDATAHIADDGSGHVALRAIPRDSGGATEVTLHVVGGRLHELEVFGSATEAQPSVDPSTLEHA